jgi:site-specific recombinase XerD
MDVGMRLYRRNGHWHVHLGGGVRRSLKTKDAAHARALFAALKRQAVEDRIKKLDDAERISLSAYRDAYLAGRKHLSPDTLRADGTAINALIAVVGESCPLRLLDLSKVKSFVAACLARGMRPVSVNTYLRHIKAALHEAVQLWHIKRVPQIKMLRTASRLPHVLPREAIQALLAHTRERDPELWRIIQFALWTGCRRSEILGLSWPMVCVPRAVARIIGKGDKEREIDLLPGALEAMGSARDLGHVFCAWHKDTLSHRFKAAARACGVGWARFHSVRHTAATYMISSGIPLQVVQRILGHSDIRTTQIYAQVMDEVRTREMGKLKFE